MEGFFLVKNLQRLAKSLHVDVNLWREGISGDQVGELMLQWDPSAGRGFWVVGSKRYLPTPDQKKGIWSTKG